MTKNRLLFVIIYLFFLSSCTYDYDINKHFDEEFKPQVVFNSLINPDSLIRGDVLWADHVDSNERDERNYPLPPKNVNKFHGKLYENDILIFDAPCTDGLFKTDIYPKAGLSYRIELDIPEYGVVKASTNIPNPTTYTSSHDEVRGHMEYSTYLHYTMDNFVVSQKSRALWVRSAPEYDDGSNTIELGLLPRFFIDNPYCDPINASNDSQDATLKGSGISHIYFLRIPYKNVTSSLPLKFSIMAFVDKLTKPKRDEDGKIIHLTEDEFGYPVENRKKIKAVNTMLMLITPSDDYDKYYKSVQVQSNSNQMQLFGAVTYTHSNIENGLGLFAGYVSETQKHRIVLEEKEK